MANPEKIQKLANTAKHLIAISETPSYPVLKEIIEKKIADQTNRFVSTPVVSQQELDYHRGVLHGMRVVLDTIEKGPAEFERAMRQARLSEEEM